MTTLQLVNKDIYIDPVLKKPIVLDGNDCLLQRLSNRLSLWLGEWFLSPTDGVDWYNLYQSNNQESVKQAITKELLSDSEVKEIRDIELKLVETDEDVAKYNKPKRTLVISNMKIDTIYGTVNI